MNEYMYTTHNLLTTTLNLNCRCIIVAGPPTQELMIAIPSRGEVCSPTMVISMLEEPGFAAVWNNNGRCIIVSGTPTEESVERVVSMRECCSPTIEITMLIQCHMLVSIAFGFGTQSVAISIVMIGPAMTVPQMLQRPVSVGKHVGQPECLLWNCTCMVSCMMWVRPVPVPSVVEILTTRVFITPMITHWFHMAMASAGVVDVVGGHLAPHTDPLHCESMILKLSCPATLLCTQCVHIIHPAIRPSMSSPSVGQSLVVVICVEKHIFEQLVSDHSCPSHVVSEVMWV